MTDLEPLDPALRELFAREREAYPEDAFARAAVLRRLQAAILLAPLAGGGMAAAAGVGASLGAGAKAGAGAASGAGAGAASGAGAGAASGAGAGAASGAGAGAASGAGAGIATGVGWKGAAVIAAVAFGSGVATNEGLRGTSVPAPAAVDVTARSAATSSLGAREDEASRHRIGDVEQVPSLVADATAADAAPRASAEAGPGARPGSPAGSAPGVSAAAATDEERALVDTARAALARGLTSAAQAAIDEHAARYPRGRLVEEREALAVQALVLARRPDAARARAARFRRAFPDSIFMPAVDRATAPGAMVRDAAP